MQSHHGITLDALIIVIIIVMVNRISSSSSSVVQYRRYSLKLQRVNKRRFLKTQYAADRHLYNQSNTHTKNAHSRQHYGVIEN